MTNNIIQCNTRGDKIKSKQITFAYFRLISCNHFLKDNENININNYTSYNFISNSRDRASGGASILIKNYIPQSQINPNIALQTMVMRDLQHKTITMCSVCIPNNS